MQGRLTHPAKQWLLGTATGLMLVSPAVADEALPHGVNGFIVSSAAAPASTPTPPTRRYPWEAVATAPAQTAAPETAQNTPPVPVESTAPVPVVETAPAVATPAESLDRPSPVLEQLRALYARDGGTMPAMRLADLPRTPEAVHQARSGGETASQPAAEIPSGVQQTQLDQDAAAAPPRVQPADAQGQSFEPPAAPPVTAPSSEGSSEGSVDPRMQQIVARAGQTGLKGFCPVALRDGRQLQDGHPEFAATFEGMTYRLSSAEAQQAFNAHPERYAPVAHGGDVVVAAAEGRLVPGVLEHGVWFRDRLYLFSTPQSKAAFVAAPQQFAAK